MTLEWGGDSEFYEVQAASKLVEPDWRTVLRTNGVSGDFSISGPATFFRVLALPDWGARIVGTSRRLAILQAIRQKVPSLSRTNAAADSQALVEFLSSFPELEGVKRSEDNSVSAYFTDGRPLVIINNRRSATPSELARKYPLNPSAPVGRLGRSAIPHFGQAVPLGLPPGPAPTAIPRSRRAALFEASVPGLAAPMLESLRPAFQNRGYAISGGEASLENLLGLQGFGNDVGIFYIDTHGNIGSLPRFEPGLAGPGIGPLKPVPTLVLTTSTIPTEQTEAFYAPNFYRAELAYAVGEPDEETGEVNFYYGITPEFARNHWQFSRASLVFIDACHSISTEANSFVQACLDNNASVYAGWSDSVTDGWAYFATRLFFDTSLGGSQIFDEVIPKQRAFDRNAILKYLRNQNYDLDQTPPPDGKGARLLFATYPSIPVEASFGLLAPSIRQMDTGSEPGRVIINGLFDPTIPATVRIQGGSTSEIDVAPRSRTELAVQWSGRDQPSAGDVTVIQNGHPSNRVPLSEWRIPAQMVRPVTAAWSQPSATIDLKLHVRADLHPVRLEPYANSIFSATAAVAAPDSTGKVVSASGVHDDGANGTVEWQLPAPVDLDWVWYLDALNGSAFKARVTFLGAGVTMFEAVAMAPDSVKEIATTKGGQRVETVIDLTGSTHANTRGSLDAEYGILAGDDSSTPGAKAFGSRLSWGAAPAAFIPDPNHEGYAE